MEARDMAVKGKKTITDGAYVGQCVSKWGNWIGDIQDPYTKGVTAMLLENQAEDLRDDESLTEDTLSTNVGSYNKYIFPVLRRVFPNLISNQIVSVQPMDSAVGAVFHFEYRYQDRKGSKVPWGGISNNAYDMAYDGAMVANDDMIKNFGVNYASEYVDYDVTCTDTAAATATLNQGSTNCRVTSWQPIRANGTSGQRTFTVRAHYRMLDADAASAPTTVIATMNGSNNLIDNTANTGNVGTFAIATGNWAITPLGSAGTASPFATNTVVYFDYYVNWELVGQTAGGAVPRANLNVTMSTITSESYPLSATWSMDAAKDLRQMHGINAEAELVAAMSNEIATEIDRKNIGALIAGAAHVAAYAYSSTVPGELESIREMLTMIDSISAAIHKTTMRHPGNFIVAPPEVCALLAQLTSHGDFKGAMSQAAPPTYGALTSNFGIQRVGTLMNKYMVYQDPWLTGGRVLVGLKGASYLDAGYVFAPHVPLEVTPTFQDPETFENKKGLKSRFATKMLRSEYYGVLTVSGLPTVTTTLT